MIITRWTRPALLVLLVAGVVTAAGAKQQDESGTHRAAGRTAATAGRDSMRPDSTVRDSTVRDSVTRDSTGRDSLPDSLHRSPPRHPRHPLEPGSPRKPSR